jgi:MoxR-like ATPase
VIIGKPERWSSTGSFLTKGQCAFGDLPGTGKTTLAKTIACSLGVDFKRIHLRPI